jgi:hypothetical protein
MLKIVLKHIHEGIKIIHSHRFNQEICVVREEEETSTLSHTFSSFEDTLNVVVIDWT